MMKTTLLFLSVLLSANIIGQDVYIPDTNFKAYLLGNSTINTNGDTEIQVTEANIFTGMIDCSELGISDLTGIEAFIALTELRCWDNQLTSLNVSQNINLNFLYCFNNQLTSLDLSQNTDLISLGCSSNQLISLDVSQNVNLQSLNIDGNQLTSLDLSQNPLLSFLFCNNNQLTSLDLSQNPLLSVIFCNNNQFISLDVSENPLLIEFFCSNNEQLTCLNLANGNNIGLYIYVYDNFNLTCMEVDNVEWSIANWTAPLYVDTQTSFSENCYNECSSSTVGIDEFSYNTRTRYQILDLMGRETNFKPNTPLIYVYDDGSIEKVFRVAY